MYEEYLIDDEIKRIKYRSACGVADRFCDAPANLIMYERPILKAICFCCGDNICTKCSSIRKYYNYGKVRLCNNCQVDYDGNDKMVMRRLRKLAGY